MAFQVLVTDEGSAGYDHNRRYFSMIESWAQTHCESYLHMHVQDVSDVSYQWDEIAEYCFEEEKDAVWFKLKWSKPR